MSEGDSARRPNAADGAADGQAAGNATPRIVVRGKSTPAEIPDDGMADTAISTPAEMMAARTPFEGASTEMADASAGGASGSGATGRPGATDSRTGPMSDSLIGAVLLDRYKVTGRIGQGGMGAVYEATHTLIGKRVAVKVLLDKYAYKDQVVARLEQEARLASSIGHENIIDITDFGQTPDGRTFVVMEYLEGQSLAECVSKDGPLPEERAIRIALQVASALSAAHAKGILHRDVKPENVFLLRRKGQDFVKVVDFGISKSLRGEEDGGASPRLTQTGMVLGTPLYMSPEQARGDDDLDQRIDVYALGVILYEMVTGEVPFQGSNYLNIISRVLNDELRPLRELRPELSAGLESVILRALAKSRDERYPSCEALAADLQAVSEDPDSADVHQRVGLPAAAPRPRRGLRSLAWIAVVGAVLSAVAVTVAMLQPGEATRAAITPRRVVPAADAAVASAAPTLAPDAAPRPAVQMASIHIVSSPAGATIYDGGRVLGPTPLVLELPRDNRAIELIAELAEHDDTSFAINPYVDDGEQITVRLKKPRRGARVRKIPRTPAPAETETQTRPQTEQRSGTAGGELGGNPYRRTD